MAKREMEDKGRTSKSRKVVPEHFDSSDPNMQVLETITVQNTTASPKPTEETKQSNLTQFDYIDIDSQVVPYLRIGYKDKPNTSDDSDDSEDYSYPGSDEEEDDPVASKIAMDMMLSGEHPDSEIDKLLESYGI